MNRASGPSAASVFPAMRNFSAATSQVSLSCRASSSWKRWLRPGPSRLSLPENAGKLALFGGIKNARFRKQVTPGDVLTLHCELVEQRGPVGIGKASAYVDGKCAATAELTFVLTDRTE